MSPRVLIRSTTALFAVSLAACSQEAGPSVAPDSAVTVEPTTGQRPDTAPQAPPTTATTVPIREAGSHEHGGASLAMARDGTTIVVELDTSLYNLLGFEHRPDTDGQRDAVASAQGVLSAPETWLAFNSEAGCEVQPPTRPVGLFGDPDMHDHDHDDDTADDTDDDAQTHRDILLNYTFRCTAPDALRRADVGLLMEFPLIESLDVVYLGPNQQVSAELSSSDTRVELRP